MVTAGGDHELDALVDQGGAGYPGAGGDLVLPVEQGTIGSDTTTLNIITSTSIERRGCTPASAVTPFI